MPKENLSLTFIKMLCIAVAIGIVVGTVHGLVIGLSSSPETSEVYIADERPMDFKSAWHETKRQLAAEMKAKMADPTWRWQMKWAPVAGAVVGVGIHVVQAFLGYRGK